MKKNIVIMERETNNIIHKVDVTGKSDRIIDKIEDGMNINLNHDLYFTTLQEDE